MRARWLIAVPVALLLLAGLAGPAGAAADSLSLLATQTDLEYGQRTTLSGELTAPAPGGRPVSIRDAASGAELAATTTDGTGHFLVDLAPAANVIVKAVSGEAESPPVDLRVTPKLTASLTAVRLFGGAELSGRLEPAHPGGLVRVTLVRGGKVAGRVDAPLVNGGSDYVAELDVLGSGKYRAVVGFDDADHEAVEAFTEARKVGTPPPLHPGTAGRWVLVLEERLRDLNYHVPKPNRGFDRRTADAVLAFHKVQGMNRVSAVTRATWARLAHPRVPRPRSKSATVHVEIDQSKQVLYIVRQGQIDEIVHTSTGAGGATRDGVFRVHRKIAGYSPNRLYYPSYFDGARAVHGWPEVPTYPASHGCSRVPFWTAKFLYSIMGYGMEVRVYH
jgi:lipoprotein-anchoring transpeptidase ErfK/SrfK